MTDWDAYTEGQIAERVWDNTDNTKFACFRVQDDSHPTRVATFKAAETAIANIEVTPINITVTGPRTADDTADDTASTAAERYYKAVENVPTDEDARAVAHLWRYKIVADDDPIVDLDPATNDGFPCGPTAPSDARTYRPGTLVTVTKSTDNDGYVCFWTKDSISNVGNAISAQIDGIQAPDITVVTNVVNPTDDDPDIGDTKSYKATDDVTASCGT